MDRFSHHAGQISLVGFCIFGKSPEATEGSRGFMEYTSKSSIGGIYFPNFGRVHEGSQGSWEWYMNPKNHHFSRNSRKKSKVQILWPPALFKVDLFMKNAVLHADTHHIFSIFYKYFKRFHYFHLSLEEACENW